MIKRYKFNSVWDALTFAGILFAIPEALAQLIHVWDLTKVNPKIVMVLTGTRKLEPKEEVMLVLARNWFGCIVVYTNRVWISNRRFTTIRVTKD